MQVSFGYLLAGAQSAKGMAVIIDVFRAFTCTPLLFSLGVRQSVFVSKPQEALDLKKCDKRLILIGEIEGRPIAGFDFGNSPSQLLRQGASFFKGRTVVQRTSSGVQGALAALDIADEVLLASYNVARATAKYILRKQPGDVSLVSMGWNLKTRAPEDDWCARYISHLLGVSTYDHNRALQEILFHKSTQRFLTGDVTAFPAEDPVICLQRNIYDFVLKVGRKEKQVVVRKIES
jgi:2-phosphosulfolactate phosphatase